AMGWVNSYYKLGQVTSGAFEEQTTAFLKQRWATLTARAPVSHYERYADLSGEISRPLDMLIAAWALSMDIFAAATQANAPLHAFTYSDLNADRDAQVRRLLDICGLDPAYLADALQGFDADSQDGSPLAQAHQSEPLNAAQRAHVVQKLSGHPAYKGG
ncbi:MAG: hypothetical protein ABI459_08345, partial [Deltaproteobacteria bacterium]